MSVKNLIEFAEELREKKSEMLCDGMIATGLSLSDIFNVFADQIEEETKYIIDIPCDEYGNPWLMDDVCETPDGVGAISGYDGCGGINIYFSETNKYKWYNLSEIKRDPKDAVLKIILNMYDYMDMHPNSLNYKDEIQSWIDQLENVIKLFK